MPVCSISPYKVATLFIWSSSVLFSKAYGDCEQDPYTPDTGVTGVPAAEEGHNCSTFSVLLSGMWEGSAGEVVSTHMHSEGNGGTMKIPSTETDGARYPTW